MTIAQSIADKAISKALDFGKDAIGSMVYPSPKSVEVPDVVEESDNDDDLNDPYISYQETKTHKLIAPVEPPKNEKRTLEELEHRALNKSKMYAELLGILDTAGKWGVAFSSMRKNDRKLVAFWELEIEKAEKEGNELALPKAYHLAKVRIESYESQIGDLGAADIDSDIADMLYESFLYDFKQKNEDNKMTPLSPFEALTQAGTILFTKSVKLIFLNKVLIAMSQKYA